MSKRTFVFGDIHGDLVALTTLFEHLPDVGEGDTLVFVGDYLDRGPASAEVVSFVRQVGKVTGAEVVALRGNHEDAWLRVIDRGWPEFVIPLTNGCLATKRSFLGEEQPKEGEGMRADEVEALFKGTFFPPDVVAWMRELPYWHEDEHALYVHAGLPSKDGAFPHPRDVEPQSSLLWCRDQRFFRDYRGKLVVFGHTSTALLPPELSTHTPEDPEDIWAGPACIGLDTRAGKGGFLTCLELPAKRVFESR